MSTADFIPESPQQSKSRRFIERYPPLIAGGYRADFSRDIRVNPPVYHLVISRVDCPTILVFTQAFSLDTLKAQAQAELEAFLRLDAAN